MDFKRLNSVLFISIEQVEKNADISKIFRGALHSVLRKIELFFINIGIKFDREEIGDKRRFFLCLKFMPRFFPTHTFSGNFRISWYVPTF